MMLGGWAGASEVGHRERIQQGAEGDVDDNGYDRHGKSGT